MTIFMLVILLSFSLMHAIEIASFATRVAGRASNRVALGTTLQQTIYTASRFLLIPFLPMLGFIVEAGILVDTYLKLVLFAFLLTFLMSIIVIIKLNSIQQFFQIVFKKYTENTIPIAVIKSFSNNNSTIVTTKCENFSLNQIVFRKTLVSVVAYLFLTTGFFVAFFLAIIFPENRLTMNQFTTTFHGLGAVIFAFYLDPMLSRSIDLSGDEESWIKNVYSILFGRELSYFVIILLLILYFLIKRFFY
jgi:hypothetical protein